MKQILIIVLILAGISSHSQSRKLSACENRIDQLYASQKLHLIFCSYYFERVNKFSGADAILGYLAFYRDTTNAAIVKKQDDAIINNLKKRICHKDASLVTEMKKWCEVSEKVAKMRAETNFTLEGYMELLDEYRYTRPVISSYFKNGRTVASLSTNEMEWIYFSSISVIKSLKILEQNRFFRKMKTWKFI
ncbi:MAG: hypothetical protein ABI863_21130 [Ginsengibacter sp.]